MKIPRRTVWLIALAALIVVGAVSYSSHRQQKKALAAAQKKAAKAAKPRKFQRPATPVIARAGLPNLVRKLKAAEPVTLAFIGGSITQNAGRSGFVAAVPAWLQRLTPGVSVEVVNAGIAGTGSDFGAQRVDRDVLEHTPDVVFVEFAVNDSDRECTADMERIVRKTRATVPAADIVFLYTVTSESLPALPEGKFPPSVLRHERVAEHYGIPTVALGSEAARKIRAGEWKWSDFSPDTCHPTPAGYGSYNVDITAALGQLLDTPGKPSAELPPALTSNLVLRPPAAQAMPQPAPRPMLDTDGTPAAATDELPLFGVQWIGTPMFQQKWELYSRALDRAASSGDPVFVSRREWRRQRWFEEVRWFTGGTSHALARSDAEAGNYFGSSPTEIAVLVWRARVEGRYTLRVAATALEGARASADATCAIHVAHFPAGENNGTTILYQEAPDAFSFTRSATLAAGDELAFAMDPRGYKFAHYAGFRVTVGRFAPPPSP